MKIKGRWHLILVATLVVSSAGAVVGCQLAPPAIVAFSASPNQISAGEITTLLWNVTGATRVSIDQAIGNVPVAGTKEVSPATTTAYTLTAANSAGTVTKSVVIAVSAASSPSVPPAETEAPPVETQPPPAQPQPPITEPTPPPQENRPPVISDLTADDLHILPSASCSISCVASDPDGDALTYAWSTTAGLVLDHGNYAGWEAPQVSGTYDVTVVVEDGKGGQATATLALLVSDDAPDTRPPDISNVKVSHITEISATITWFTREDSTCQVEYGLTNAYGSTTPLEDYQPNPRDRFGRRARFELTNLEPDTIYHYRVKSRDAAGNEAIQAGDFIFRTLPVGDVTPPIISDLTVTYGTDSSLTVTWTTDEPATSHIQLQRRGASMHRDIRSDELTMNHSLTATDLCPDAPYYFHVTSSDTVRHPGYPCPFGNAPGMAICELVFTPGANPISVPSGPTVITNEATNITSNSATLNGYLTSLGTNSAATVSFHWGGRPTVYPTKTLVRTMDAPGAFSFDLTGLSPAQTMYFRAGANTSWVFRPQGAGCCISGYGNTKSFTTTSDE